MDMQTHHGLEKDLSAHLPHWQEVYRDMHAHPEVAFNEYRTAGLVARELRAMGGWDVVEGVGGTGVVGILRSGPGPVVLLRADMDALPVQEHTGLPYASTEPGLMHACGHDMHVACLLGACRQLARNPGAWGGTVVAVFQPAEETGKGARAMLDDGLLDRFPRPDVCLGQHVGPLPAGVVVSRAGTLMAAADSLRVTLHGAGGHASTPQMAVHPVVLAAAVVMRLQTFTAQQAPLSPATGLTVGALRSGTAANIIPDDAELVLSLRTFSDRARAEALATIEQIVHAEATASNAPKAPEIELYDPFPLTINTPGVTAQVLEAIAATGATTHTLPMPLAASEDFGQFAAAAGCPSVFWHFGGTDPARFSPADTELLKQERLPANLPSNHSPRYAPSPELAVPAGIRFLLAAAAAWF